MRTGHRADCCQFAPAMPRSLASEFRIYAHIDLVVSDARRIPAISFKEEYDMDEPMVVLVLLVERVIDGHSDFESLSIA
jgi:hypothetical protein